MFLRVARSIQPFVISIHPSTKNFKFSGRKESSGEKHSMTIKNIVIMQPT